MKRKQEAMNVVKSDAMKKDHKIDQDTIMLLILITGIAAEIYAIVWLITKW